MECTIDTAGRELLQRITPELDAAYCAIGAHLVIADALRSGLLVVSE